MHAMPVERIDSLDDPRLKPYRALKDRELAREGDLFIAEGEFLVRRLLASDFPVYSLLLANRRVDEISALAAPTVPILAVDDELMKHLLGFKFHSGVMGCGQRKTWPSLDQLIADAGERATLLVCSDTINAENMGSLIRIAAGFGVTAMLLGPQCCDPYWRRSVRVSMGTLFRLPVVRCDDLPGELRRLRQQHGFQLIATVLDSDAQPLHSIPAPPRLALLAGGEAHGLPRDIVELCDRRATIPMRLGTDSLNVSIATAVFLYHFTRPDPPPAR